MRRSRWTVLLAFALALGCAGAPVASRTPVVNTFVRWVPKLGEYARPEMPDADFRSAPPGSGPAMPIVAPKIEEKRLVNGMRVLWVERHDLPIVSLRFVSSVGAAHGDPGLTDFLVHACLKGVKGKADKYVAITLEGMGVGTDAGTSFDGSAIAFRMLPSQLQSVLELTSTALRRTSYAPIDIDRERGTRLLALTHRRDDRDSLATDHVRATIFPSHVYGLPILGTPAVIERITAGDVGEHHALVFDPRRLSVVAAGDIDRTALIVALEEGLADWKGAGREPVTLPQPALDGSRKIVIVDRPGDAQARIRVSGLAPKRGAPGAPARSVVSTILSRRLSDTLREKRGWTYATHADIAAHRMAGLVTVGGAIEVDHAGGALAEMLAELTRLGTNPVPDEELSTAKRTALATWAAAFETLSGITDALSMLTIYERPTADWTKGPEHFSAVTAENVLTEAKAHFAPAAMSIVVVGDASKLRPQLEALSLGKIEIRTGS